MEAAKVAEQIDDTPINTDTWTDGETATIRSDTTQRDNIVREIILYVNCVF